jgi:hypothetical protein
MSAFLKNWPVKVLGGRCFYLRHAPLLGFCFGVVKNFVGSESGQIHSVLLLNMLSTKPDPLPPCYTLYKYIPLCTYSIHTGRGGGR